MSQASVSVYHSDMGGLRRVSGVGVTLYVFKTTTLYPNKTF